MNEMIFGNTGRRDEGINIDMDQALYQKLQSRTFVPKLKELLNSALQEGDKSFVFVGDVSNKTSAYSVYGYNAKLANDSRGGDFAHYVSTPLDSKFATVNFGGINFLTEDGFVEYANTKTLNDEKRFTISPLNYDIDINTKKLLVNNLMETFTRARKRKNVTFSLADCPIDEFNAKSIFIMMDLMKYLPYRMRKNISFVSHVCSNQKLPDMINLAVYPASCEFKPHDCINAESNSLLSNDATFALYIDKVFAMSDFERETYFEKLHQEIELPALAKISDIKSDLYLLDVHTKEYWANGEINDVVAGIFNAFDDVLNIYPIYREIAKNRLASNKVETFNYIKSKISETATPEELNVVYKNARNVFNVCEFNFSDAVIAEFKAHSNSFIEKLSDEAELINVMSEIVSNDKNILDAEYAINKFKFIMCGKNTIADMYKFYLQICDNDFVDNDSFVLCLKECLGNLIMNETEKFADAKDKLAEVEKMYHDFKESGITNDFSHVKEVCDFWGSKYSQGASNEAKAKGEEIFNNIDKQLMNNASLLDVKNCIVELADVEVKYDDALKQTATSKYKEISKKMWEQLSDAKLSCEQLNQLICELSAPVKTLDENGVLDGSLKSGWGDKKYVPNGMYRFVTIFESIVSTVNASEKLVDVFGAFENAKDEIETEEDFYILDFFNKYISVVLFDWLAKHKKFTGKGAIKKAKKEFKKQYNKVLPRAMESSFEDFFKPKKGKKKKLSLVGIIIIAVLCLVIAAAAAFGVYWFILKGDEPKDKPQNKPTSSRSEKADNDSDSSKVEKEDVDEQETSKEETKNKNTTSNDESGAESDTSSDNKSGNSSGDKKSDKSDKSN